MKAFLLGLGIGGVIGLLVTPDSGEANRRKLRSRVTEWSQSLQTKIDNAKQQMKTEAASTRSASQSPDEAPVRKEPASEKEVRGTADPLNTMTREELMEVNGIGPVLAEKIISNRPYSSTEDLHQRGILPQSAFDELESQLKRHKTRSA
jgi:DNA uptake protein ComE-like DNA-binding protein